MSSKNFNKSYKEIFEKIFPQPTWKIIQLSQYAPGTWRSETYLGPQDHLLSIQSKVENNPDFLTSRPSSQFVVASEFLSVWALGGKASLNLSTRDGLVTVGFPPLLPLLLLSGLAIEGQPKGKKITSVLTATRPPRARLLPQQILHPFQHFL